MTSPGSRVGELDLIHRAFLFCSDFNHQWSSRILNKSYDGFWSESGRAGYLDVWDLSDMRPDGHHLSVLIVAFLQPQSLKLTSIVSLLFRSRDGWCELLSFSLTLSTAADPFPFRPHLFALQPTACTGARLECTGPGLDFFGTS